MLSVWWIIGLAPSALLVDPILPAGCPSVREIKAQVEAFAPDVSTQSGRMRIGITAVDGRLEAQLSVEQPGQPTATRVMIGAASDCSALVSAVALTAALVLEPAQPPPAVKPQPVAPPSVPPVTPASLAVAPASAAPAIIDTATPARDLGLRAHAALLGSTGALPGMGMSLEAGGGLRGDAWRIDLAARMHLPLSADVPGGAIGGQLWAGVGTGCGVFDAIALCGLVCVGYQTLDGADFENNRNVSGLYLAGGARAEYAWRLFDAWSIAAVGEMQVPLTRLRLTVSEAVVWETPAAVGAMGVDLSRRF